MNSFTDILQEFCPDINQYCSSIEIFRASFLQSPWIITYDLNRWVLCNSMHNVILLALRACLKNLCTDPPKAFINDIPLKKE